MIIVAKVIHSLFMYKLCIKEVYTASPPFAGSNCFVAGSALGHYIIETSLCKHNVRYVKYMFIEIALGLEQPFSGLTTTPESRSTRQGCGAEIQEFNI